MHGGFWYLIRIFALSLDFMIQDYTEMNTVMKELSTKNAPAAIGPYSQGIEANGFVYVSGQLPINPATGEFAEGGIKAEARQSLANIRNILAEAGLTMGNVVKVTVLMTDIRDFAAVNEVYAEFFEAPYPARSAFAVAALPKGADIEIEAIAAK
jgi:2-iminobutanoate/2-iminopropanoate deaminase